MRKLLARTKGLLRKFLARAKGLMRKLLARTKGLMRKLLARTKGLMRKLLVWERGVCENFLYGSAGSAKTSQPLIFGEVHACLNKHASCEAFCSQGGNASAARRKGPRGPLA